MSFLKLSDRRWVNLSKVEEITMGSTSAGDFYRLSVGVREIVTNSREEFRAVRGYLHLMERTEYVSDDMFVPGER